MTVSAVGEGVFGLVGVRTRKDANAGDVGKLEQECIGANAEVI